MTSTGFDPTDGQLADIETMKQLIADATAQ